MKLVKEVAFWTIAVPYIVGLWVVALVVWPLWDAVAMAFERPAKPEATPPVVRA